MNSVTTDVRYALRQIKLARQHWDKPLDATDRAIEALERVFEGQQRALELAVMILARDSVNGLEGYSYSQSERERVEAAAGLTVESLRK